jgi:hypothetical protein
MLDELSAAARSEQRTDDHQLVGLDVKTWQQTRLLGCSVVPFLDFLLAMQKLAPSQHGVTANQRATGAAAHALQSR